METADKDLSVDDISLSHQIATESGEATDCFICTNISEGNNSIRYPSLERIQNSDTTGTASFPTQIPDKKHVPQQAWNRRKSESSGKGVPEEDFNSNEALVTNLDNKEHCRKVRGGDVDDKRIESRLSSQKFDGSENTNDGQCKHSLVISCQRTDHKKSFASEGWSPDENIHFIRPEIDHQMQGDEYGNDGPMWPVLHPKYKDYGQRLNTFEDWTKKRPSEDQLANAGLFYQGTQDDDITDMVYCYKCGGSLMKFKDDDDPQKEHDRLYPGCRNTNWY